MSHLFLHGFLGLPAAWDEVRALLGVTPERGVTLPGHGPSPWLPAGDFTDIIDAIAERHLPESPVTVVGYSLGARVALSLALRYPRRVTRAVLIGVAYGINDPRDRESRRLADESLARAIERDGVEAFVGAWEELPLFASQRGLAPERLASQRAWRTAHTAAGLAWSLRALGLGAQPSYRGAIARSDVPMELITGEFDDKFTAIARECVRLRSNIAHTVVSGAGHNVVLETPDAVARALAR